MNRIIERAHSDEFFEEKVREIAKLDSTLLPSGFYATGSVLARLQTRDGQEMTQRLSDLCDEVAETIAEPTEDAASIASWISYNCQSIVQRL